MLPCAARQASKVQAKPLGALEVVEASSKTAGILPRLLPFVPRTCLICHPIVPLCNWMQSTVIPPPSVPISPCAALSPRLTWVVPLPAVPSRSSSLPWSSVAIVTLHTAIHHPGSQAAQAARPLLHLMSLHTLPPEIMPCTVCPSIVVDSLCFISGECPFIDCAGRPLPSATQ